METNSGKQGGNLKGKPHYDENGNPAGGIKAVVTDGNAKRPVELEQGEVIINAEAAKKHWKKLSEINQSAGNGVPIHNPNSVSSDEDPEEYKDGGKVITFNRNHIPKKNLVRYVAKLKADHPEIWKLGGNIFGNEAFENLKRVSDRGYWLDSEKWIYVKWRSYVARHKHDFRIEGVVAMLKWVDVVDKGLPYMKELVEKEIKMDSPKPKNMQEGGSVNFEDELFKDLSQHDAKSFNKGGELKMGIVDEKEHLGTIEKIYNHEVSPDKAPELIAKDHLKEDPNYYTKLNKMEETMAKGSTIEELKTDRKGNYIGDGSYHADYYVFEFPQYPQISSYVNFSETTESVYVTYTNTENDKTITVRYSDHVNNATLFGDQLDENTASKQEILYRLGLLKRTFVPKKRLEIAWGQPKKKDLPNYEIADKTIKEMYDLGAGADISMYKGKLAKDSSYLIYGDKVNEITEGWHDAFGNYVRKGNYVYEEFGNGGNIFTDKENNIIYTVEKNPQGIYTIYSKKEGEWDKRDEYPEGFPSEEDAILVANHISGILGEFETLSDLKNLESTTPDVNNVEDQIKSNILERNEILERVDLLNAEHKKKYRDVDIESPKSAEEKESENQIRELLSQANKFNEINKRLRQGVKMELPEGALTFEEFKKLLPPVMDIDVGDNGIEYRANFDRYSGNSKYYKNGRKSSTAHSVVDAYKTYLLDYKSGSKNEKINMGNYKNPYEINRAIEALIDQKGPEQSSYTPDEIKFLSYYSGYGGLEKQGSFSQDELKGILYEYYTPDEVVKKMWGLAYKYGYGSVGDNSVFEPSCGTGAFIKYAPENVIVAANEINKYSATICEILYPHAQVALRAFETNFIKQNLSIKGATDSLKKYSLVIGNPPYGRLYSKYIAMGEDKYTMAANFTEYFITRGIDLLCKDGLLVFIVGAEQYNGGNLFLDSALTKTKRAIFDKADLIDAYRLPTKIFERTGVSTEILIFRKR